ncbi:MAG: D-(-)-3-hydroxybutyrate oligomer hydrolase [Pseudomonadota bacterium]
MKRAVRALPAALLSCLALSALADEGGGPLVAGTPNIAPSWLGEVIAADYDGVTDDLLTAGLGKTGLGGAAPAVTDPTDPKQLRRLAIYNNYRALVDGNPLGGYGTLYGPNVKADGTVTADEGRIAGTEHLAFADRGRGRRNVTLMVQVPANFDPARPCIVTGTSSGSRGVYGAIGTSGEWGLKRGCAVAYSDKGTGNGVHDLQNNTVNLIDGVRADAAIAGDDSNFTARLSDLARQQFNADTPNRFAVKHAHSQQNPEKDWGRDTLRAVEFAFYVLNEKFGAPGPDGGKRRTIVPANTIVIASSASNGAGAALAAAEEDRHGLIDGVAVSEPQIQIDPRRAPVIRRGSLVYTGGSRPLYDYLTFANLYQPCAALSARAAGSPLAALLIAPFAQNRCASLAAKGLLASTTLAAQAEEALDKLLAYGWEPESALLHRSHYALATPAIAMTYSNSYGRFSVADNLCGLSFGAVDVAGAPIPAPAAAIATIFGTGNGIPPTGPIQIINNDSVGGPRRDALSISPSTNLQDYNIDGAICQRELWTGANRDRRRDARRVRRGIAEVQRTADLNGKPAIIVHGRNDTLVPVNFSSRPYYARNRQVEGRASRLSYIEVTNAQHFDAFLAFAGFDTRYVPLHVYLIRALDAMYAHLTSGAPLPPSQVVRTTPRGGTSPAPALTPANVPAWSADPPAADRIEFDGDTLTIPD